VLRDQGTTWAFGHPGGEVITFIDALREAGIRFVLTRHEATAAFAAGGYAELTGRPGLCVATLGPGATNLVTGVASALLERAPLVALTGRLAEGAPPGTTHQDLPLTELFTSVSKGSWVVSAEPTATTRIAVATALAERPGPVHLALAADVAARPVVMSPPRDAAGSNEPGVERHPGGPDPATLDRARRLLSEARRPAIVTGLTTARMRVEDAVRGAAETLGAPVATTPKAKGVVPEDHPLFLGVLDMAGDALVGEVLERADLILALGCDVVELDRAWSWPAPVIHVDVGANVDGYYGAEVELVGPIEVSLSQLLDGARPSSWDVTGIRQARDAVIAFARHGKAPLQPWQVVERVQAGVPPGTLATCDVGAHKMIVGQLWRTNRPREFLMANGLSSMGYSIPTALAAHLVDPERPVVAFLGDGGLGMYLGELETLVRVEARLTIVVFADRSLELIRRSARRREIETHAVDFENPDFAALGRAFGIGSMEVETVAELDAAVARSVADDGVRLIAARVEGSDYRL
jgi:acetolactate synthase-1/2/3 large subunit